MKVTDAWSGDLRWLRRDFPGLKASPDLHEHVHHDGGYYTHTHSGGRDRHEHSYECREYAHGPGGEDRCVMPPEGAGAIVHEGAREANIGSGRPAEETT